MVSDYEVILPTFNGEKFLSQLDSIGNQSLSPARIIISDDGSSDSTLNIIHQWSMSNHIPVTLLPNDGIDLAAVKILKNSWLTVVLTMSCLLIKMIYGI